MIDGEFYPETRELDRHGLTKDERPAVESLVKAMGYEDGLDQLVSVHGYESAIQIAEENSFTSVRDYFLGDGWHQRTAEFRKNGPNSKRNNSR